MEILLRDENSNLKFTDNEDKLLHLVKIGVFEDTVKTIRKYKNGSSANIFTFKESYKIDTPLGNLWIWEGDYFQISVHEHSVDPLDLDKFFATAY